MKITQNHLKLWLTISKETGWFTVSEVKEKSGCTTNTVQRYVKFLASIGALESAKVHPAPLYKVIACEPRSEGADYWQSISALSAELN